MNTVINILTVLLCLVPAGIYLAKRLAPDKTFLLIALFWFLNAFLYLPDLFTWKWYTGVVNSEVIKFYNLLETPLMILIIYSAFRNSFLVYLLWIFLGFELVMVLWKGHNFESSTPIIGIGSGIGLIMNIWAISIYFRKMRHDNFETSIAFVNAGYIFYYGLFTVTYIFSYLNHSDATFPYVTFINFFSIVMAAGVIVVGLWKYAESPLKEELV